jgi:hypothetical protein
MNQPIIIVASPEKGTAIEDDVFVNHKAFLEKRAAEQGLTNCKC